MRIRGLSAITAILLLQGTASLAAEPAKLQRLSLQPTLSLNHQHHGEVRYGFVPSGKFLITWEMHPGDGRGYLEVWATESWLRLKPIALQSSWSYSVEFLPSDDLLLTGSEIKEDYTYGREAIWLLTMPTCESKLLTARREFSVYSRDGRLRAYHPKGTRGEPNETRIVVEDSATGRIVSDFSPYESWSSPEGFTPGGECLLFRGSDFPERKFQPKAVQEKLRAEPPFRVWDLVKNQEYRPWRILEAGQSLVGFSKDATKVITSTVPGGIWVTDLRTGRSVAHYGSAGYGISLSPDGEYAVFGGYDRETTVWHYPSGRAVTWLSHRDAPTDARFSPDGKWVVTTGYREDNRILLWDTEKIRNAMTGRSSIR